jgi:hypothetical protein
VACGDERYSAYEDWDGNENEQGERARGKRGVRMRIDRGRERLLNVSPEWRGSSLLHDLI